MEETNLTAPDVEAALHAAADPAKAVGMLRFFKTGPGQYGEGDRFLGINNPTVRRIAREYRALPLPEAEKLLKKPLHEIRLCALLVLVAHYLRGKEETQRKVLDIYLAHTSFVNNWDLVDLSAPGIVGEAALNHDAGILDPLAASSNLWEQRIAMVATLTPIRHHDFTAALRLAEYFLTHRHDLMHKATGWMLREIGKRDRARLTEFLVRHRQNMPRTMLRYAIEHYPEDQRREWLKK